MLRLGGQWPKEERKATRHEVIGMDEMRDAMGELLLRQVPEEIGTDKRKKH